MITPYTPRRDVAPYKPVTLDIETSPEDGVIGVGCCVDGDVWLFEDWDGWWTWYYPYLTQHQSPAKLRRIYAHNGAGFDWLSFIQWAHDQERINKLEYIHSESFGIGVNITVDNVILRLRDSFRLLPASLAKLCETFAVDHAKLDIDVLPHILKATDPEKYWQYLANDVRGLQEVIYRFWQQIYAIAGSVEELPMTLPALSMKLWRKTLTEPIMTNWNKKLKALERRAYTGGRTECFDIGETNIEIYDANSEYPTVMLAGLYPISYRGGWVRDYRGEHGLYEITYIQQNRNYKPVLRDETSNEFQYEGSGVYTQPEIEELLKKDGVITVKQGYVFTDISNPFQRFIAQWWNIRHAAIAKGDEAMAFVCKILMNSLYGKFGQREEGYTLKLLSGDEQERLLVSGTTIKIEGEYTLVLEDRHSEYTFVSIAAYITAQARLHLYKQMCMAQDMGYKLYATDTDSVHVSGGTMETSDGLGGWKNEYSGDAVYLGKKLYALANGVLKSKGVAWQDADGKKIEKKSEEAKKLYRLFCELARNPESSYEVEFIAFPSWRENLIQGIPVGQMIERKRTIRATAHKDNDNAKMVGRMATGILGE